MSSWTLSGLAGLAWLLVIYKLRAAWRDSGQRSQSVTFHVWVFTLCAAIGATFMIHPVYLAFDELVGLPNLGWLLLSIAFCLAIYYFASACYLLLKQERPAIMRWSLLFTLLLLSAVYLGGIITLPEKPEHTIPETVAEVIFMETLYIYIGAFCAIPIVTFARLLQNEKVVSSRLRWMVGMMVTLASTSVMVMKSVLTVLAYLDPETSALKVLYPSITIGVLLGGTLSPAAFLPNRFYTTLARPFEFVSKLRMLRHLSWLKGRLDRLCPSVVNVTVDIPAYLGNLDFHLYRTIIAILDAKQVLNGYAQATDGFMMQPSLMTDPHGQALRHWNEQDLAEARLLHHSLQAVDDHVGFSALMYGYYRVERATRRQLSAIHMGGTHDTSS